MNCEFARTTVHAYFDGELDAVRSADFEAHAEICVECQSELKAIGTLRKRIQESDLFEQASPQLLNRISKQIAQETNKSRVKVFSAPKHFLIPAFGALAAAAASVAIVFLVLQSHNQATRITAELIDAHVRSLQPGHLTDVLSTDQHTVKPWFDGKLDFIPPVSDFSQQGFPLVGGRLDIVNGHNVAALVYGRRKHLVSVFVWPYRGREPSLVSSGSYQGYNWLRWQSGEMEFCLVSDASATDLRELKELIRQ
ncbi:MAG: anti-sigma factor family protein [Terriglobales bacterium]